MSAWQPIETAPKDGTWILAARIGEPIGIDQPCEVIAWEQCAPEEDFEFVLVPAVNLYRRVRKEYDRSYWRGANGHRATHWMPLPDPPQEAR